MSHKEKMLNSAYRVKYYHRLFIAFKVFSYVLLVAPCLVLFGINFNKYFPLETTNDKLSFSGSVVILAVCLLLAVIQAVKHIEDKKITFFFTSFYWFAAAGITYLLAELFNDITLICLCIGGGMLLCASFNALSTTYKEYYKEERQGNTNANAIKQALKEEKKKKKEEGVKVETTD